MNIYIVTYRTSASNATVYVVAENLVKMLEVFETEHSECNILNIEVLEKKQGERFQYWKPTEEQLEALDYAYNSCPDTERGNYYEGVLETLIDDLHKLSEKQGEQKPTDKVEPIYKVGDWVVFNNKHQSIYQVEKIEDGYYILRHTHGGTLRGCVLHDESLRLWTIKDAKKGDVLATKSGNKIFLYNGKRDLRRRPCAYCGIYKGFSEFIFSKCAIGKYFTEEDVYPTTKEQRNLLFQKMKEAGYEWDDEKKELKKITMEYIDLGLPSGTLWCDTNEKGYYTFNDDVEKYGDSLPTKEQWEELKNLCQWEWENGRYTITGPNGNCIILPADGNYNCNGRLYGVGFLGSYWSSTPYGSDSAWSFDFCSDGVGVDYYSRGFGKSVRLVK